MSYAKFYFANRQGQRRALDPQSELMLGNVSGLGAHFEPECADLGEGFFRLIKNAQPRQSIMGDLIFRQEAYETYRRLMDWLLSSEELMFIYCPRGTDEFYRRISVEYVEKGLRSRGGRLSCAVSLCCLTPWFLPAPLNLNFEKQSESVMRYDFRYDSALLYGSHAAGACTVQISPAGHLPAALKVSYTGQASDPVISLRGLVTGEEHGRCAIAGDFLATDRIELYTAQNEGYVRKVAQDGTITELLDVVDISFEPFFRVPLTEPCQLKLSAANTLSGEATAQVFYYYRTV